jgi:NAD(P)H dehydrogenase (quinone)
MTGSQHPGGSGDVSDSGATGHGGATIAITGVTGALGGMVSRALAEAGVSQRMLARTPSKAPALPGATVVEFDYADRSACETALSGVETLFFVSGREDEHRLSHHRAVVDAAAAAGVRHVVYTSFVGASPKSTFTLGRDHYATEQFIEASGVAYTFLRDNFYQDLLPYFVGDDGILRGPAGHGRAAFVARADVARVATAVLQDAGAHAGRTYDLTGPEALTLYEVATLLTTGLRRSVSYVDETVPEAYASRAHYGAPDWQVDAWVSTYTAIRAGELEGISDDIETITGRPATSLAQLLTAAG